MDLNQSRLLWGITGALILLAIVVYVMTGPLAEPSGNLAAPEAPTSGVYVAPVSASDAVDVLEAELEETNLSGIEADLDAIDLAF